MTDTKVFAKDFNIYRASQKDPTRGAMLSLRLHKAYNAPEEGSDKVKMHEGSIKLTLIKQTGPMEFQGDRVQMKLNTAELVQLMQGFANKSEVKLFHKYNDQTGFACSSNLTFKYDVTKDGREFGGITLNNTTAAGNAYVSISLGVTDLITMRILFEAAIPLIHGWC